MSDETTMLETPFLGIHARINRDRLVELHTTRDAARIDDLRRQLDRFVWCDAHGRLVCGYHLGADVVLAALEGRPPPLHSALGVRLLSSYEETWWRLRLGGQLPTCEVCEPRLATDPGRNAHTHVLRRVLRQCTEVTDDEVVIRIARGSMEEHALCSLAGVYPAGASLQSQQARERAAKESSE